jgi:kinesin family protein 3/17
MSDDKGKDDKGKSGGDNETIQVVVRCRPLSKKELEEKRKSIIDIDVEARQVAIKNPDNLEDKPKYFTFDGSYDENTQQRIFYEESCFGIIESALEGFNSTIFAYGQTGCGKSYTMQGYTSSNDLKGVIPNSFAHIFEFIKVSKDIEFLIRCSYLELYNEEIRDLLANSKSNIKCELKEDGQKGIYVKNLTDVVVETEEDMSKVLERGLSSRTVASTLMNSESSRSHSIFTVVIEMNSKDKNTGKDMVRVGKLNLVDLAGSERQKKTGAKDAVLKEGIKINLSLSALGNVISALSEGSKHIPYRDSKLTRLLQDSLGGNSKTMMIAAISPADYNYDETMSTLRYANRAKNIKNKPKINEDPKDTIIREFKEEIERLRKLLSEQANISATVLSSSQAPTQIQPAASENSALDSNNSQLTNSNVAVVPIGSPSTTRSPRAGSLNNVPKNPKLVSDKNLLVHAASNNQLNTESLKKDESFSTTGKLSTILEPLSNHIIETVQEMEKDYDTNEFSNTAEDIVILLLLLLLLIIIIFFYFVYFYYI